jgi:hypothetical protein
MAKNPNYLAFSSTNKTLVRRNSNSPESITSAKNCQGPLFDFAA